MPKPSSIIQPEPTISDHNLTPQIPLPPHTPTHSPPEPVKALCGAQLKLPTSYSHLQLAYGPFWPMVPPVLWPPAPPFAGCALAGVGGCAP